VESISGSLHGRIKLAGSTSEPHVGVRVAKSDAAVQVKGLPGPVRLEKAAVEADPRIVKAEDTALSMPAGRLLLTSLRYTLKDCATAAAADFDLDLPQTLALVRGVLPEESRASLDSIESLDGRARGNVKLALAKSGWNVVGEIVHSDAKVQVRGLPGPATLAGVAVRARPKAVSIENARVAFLDSSVTASARLSDFQNGPKVEGSVAAATIGAKALAWVWQSAALPPRLDLKTPIQVTVPHFTWGPKPALDLQANARFDAGPALAVDMAWSPTALDVRRATIKDAMTDVTVALRSAGAVIEGSYGGTLDSRSLAAMRKSATAPAGEVSGDLRFRIDREQRSRSMAQGTLKGQNLDLSALAGQPAKLERLELSADGAAVRIGEAALDWNGQRVALRGDLKRGAEGPVIDAQVDSPGILIDALLPKTPAQAPDKAGKADKTPDAPAIWPLPVTGRIAMRAGFIQYAHYKVAPVVTTLVLEEKRAHLDTQEAQICGIALPFTADATPDGGFAVAAQITAQKQPVEQTAKCLTGEGVQLTGTMDLKASLQTEGKVADLVRNLRGSVTADVRDGQVMKFALIGNILSMQNVVALVTQGGPKLGAEGFPFRKLAAKGRLDKGLFFLDEGVFHSNTIGLGANGWISLSDFQTRLTVLVAPLALVDEAVRKLPVLGYVIGGTFTSLPVGVSGDIRDPTVVPLGPRAITNELTGIFERTITLPGRLVPGETKGKP